MRLSKTQNFIAETKAEFQQYEDEPIQNYADNQLTADMKMLHQAAETLADEREKEEFSCEVGAIISEHIEVADTLLKKYNKAWQLLRYGRYVEEEY